MKEEPRQQNITLSQYFIASLDLLEMKREQEIISFTFKIKTSKLKKIKNIYLVSLVFV